MPCTNPGSKALRIGRFSQPQGIYFITTGTDDRIPWFSDFELGCRMSRHLAAPGSMEDASLMCWVIMPDHLHILVQLGSRSLAKVINRLKSRSAIALNREIGRKGRFWESGFYDHALRKEEDAIGIARYIVANPLRANLVNDIRHYPFWNSIWL